jgi:hypothetical protein
MSNADMKQELEPVSPVLADSINEYGIGQIDEAKLLRKIDLRVLPMLFLIYVAAFLDRCVCSSTEPLCCRTSELMSYSLQC